MKLPEILVLAVNIAAWPLEGVEIPAYGSLQSKPSPAVAVKGLELSRPPTTVELMAAGQLGGALHPTHELADPLRDQEVRIDFGQAIETWNRHEYSKAVTLFRHHAQQYPDSPWAAEAILHVGCDATYHGRYHEADRIFSQLMATYQSRDNLGAQRLYNKALQRLALLRLEQNNLNEASSLFGRSIRESPDWRDRTYASHWIQALARYGAAKQALLTCGSQALAYALEKEGRRGEAAKVRGKIPATLRGHSLADLVTMAGDHGFEMCAVRVDPDNLAAIPLPAILHILPYRGGNRGHFWVLDKVQEGAVEIYDPQSQHRFHQSFEELKKEWTGITLIFRKGGPLPGEPLAMTVMEELTGGCCGAKRNESNLGDPQRNGQTGNQPDTCPLGAPRWLVNVVNMNLFVTDTPLWYDSPVGPPVRITLSYNSQSAIAQHEPFGNKWQCNYASYLVVDTAGTVTLFMPDGRRDLFTPDGLGGYRRPYQVFNTLVKQAENHFELRFPDDTVYVYRIPPGTDSQQPFLTEIRDAYGQRLTIGYDAEVRLTAVTDAQGEVFTFSYNSSGNCTTVADPFGRQARFEYDASQNLTKITDMGGYWSSFSYDTNVYLTSIANELDRWKFWIEAADGIFANSDNYPPPGDLMWENYRITITNPLGAVEEFFFYGGYAEYTWYVSPRDYLPWQSQTVNNFRLPVPKTLFYHRATDRQGELWKITRPEGGELRYRYDEAGNRISVTDFHNHTWRYDYNDMGRVTSISDAKDTRTDLLYAGNNVDLLSISNGLGEIRLAYNAQHDLVSLTDRLGHRTSFSYNPFGQLVSQTDALGLTNQYLYDANQRLTEFRRAGLILERYAYDPMGRIRTRTDATGLTLTHDYNDLNQIVRVTYPDGRFESYAYSTCCPRLLDHLTDRGGRTNFFFYDAAKRLSLTINPERGVTRFGYDANGNRTSLTDPNGNVTTFTYDLDDRLVRKTYADGKGLSFGYDADGLLITRTNGRGIVTTYTYDPNHNLLTTTYSDDTPGVTNTFDEFNRLIGVVDGVGNNLYTYDANSRLSRFDGPWLDDTITYAYDALGRRTNLSVQGSEPTVYDFDTLNRLVRVRVGSQPFVYTYAGASPLVQRLDRPNGSYTTYQYDGLNRLTLLSNRRSTGEVINEFGYTYNAQDLRDSETVSNGLAMTFTNQQVTYDYNRLNQLLASTPPNQLFAYDDDGNMTRGYTPEGLPFAATYDAENRLKSVTVTNGGSLVARIEYLHAWNNFLAQEKRERPSQGSNQVRHVRARYLPLQERDADNNINREFGWGLSKGGGIEGLLSLRQAGQGYSYVYDGKGNVVVVLDTDQGSAASYAYDAFGVLLSTAGSLDQPFRLSTKPYDSVTGLSYFGRRFYSPCLAKWLTRDPAHEETAINVYSFVRNNPLSYFDPDGAKEEMENQSWWWWFWNTVLDQLTQGVKGMCEFKDVWDKNAPKINERLQAEYEEWADLYGYGPENPLYTSAGVRTKDGKSYLERQKGRQEPNSTR